MKKSFLLVTVLALLGTGSLHAQVSGGARLGANIANLKYAEGDLSEMGDSKFGPMVGLYLTAMLTDQLGIQPELVYASLGSKDGDETTKLGYISIPILVRYQIIEQIHILVGPQASFLASAKIEEDGEDFDVKDDLKGLDFGGVIGVGADIDRFNAGLRYVVGFANILDIDDDLKIKNRALQIVVGYRLFGGD